MNGEQLINDIMRDTGKIQTLTTDTNYRAMALRWANRVKNYIGSRHPKWTWLEVNGNFDTVDNRMSYDIPSGVGTAPAMNKSGHKVISLRQKDSPAKLTYIHQSIFDALEPDPTQTTGNPTIYTFNANSLRLWPVPDAVYTMYLRYAKYMPDDFADNGTEHADLPKQWEWVVLAGMRELAFRYEPEWGDYKAEHIIFEDGVSKMIDDNNLTLDSDDVSKGHGENDTELIEPYRINLVDLGI